MSIFGSAAALFKGGGDIDPADLMVVPGAPPLVGSHRRGVVGGAAPKPPATKSVAASAKPPGWKPSIARILNDVVLGSSTIGGSIDAQRAKAAGQARQQQYVSAIDAMNLSPQEKLLALNSPDEFMKALGTRASYHAEDGGKTVFNAPGQSGPYVTQKLVEDDGVYGTQDAGGYHETGRRGQSYGELETNRHNMEEERRQAELAKLQDFIQRGQLDVSRGSLGVQQGQLGVAQGHLGVARAAEARQGAAAGLGAPGGAGGGPTPQQLQQLRAMVFGR